MFVQVVKTRNLQDIHKNNEGEEKQQIQSKKAGG
jgi:hypothetical protein